MKIVTYDELTDKQMVDVLTMTTAAFGGAWDIKAIELKRQKGGCLSDYFGLYAVEEGTVIGQVVVYRIDYTFPDGQSRKVSGLAGVTTRADKSKRGVARQIIEAVHAREMEAGIQHSLLWTNMSWRAHGLYLDLGYRDILSQPLVYKVMDRKRKLPHGLSLVRAEKKDIPSIVDMHSKSTAGLKGFVHRAPGQLSAWVETGSVDIHSIYIVRKGAEQVGYIYREKNRSTVRCRELVVKPSCSTGEVLEAVESVAPKGGVVMFRDVPTQATVPFFRERGYDIFPSQWKVLMGTQFGRGMSEQEAIEAFGTASDDFVCQAGDNF